ncbi:helix-turn-helix domain-containing protein [Alteribacter lacisalsi]|nr:helix-turn-helix domain-containing protein [Alteribacter lacisalsi]
MAVSLLIADRDPEECRGIKWFAEHTPVDFVTIASAVSESDLIRRLHEQTYQMIILELDMFPGGVPDSVLSRIHAFPSVQIIATSAEATYEKAREALSLKALDLLIKPHSVTRLQALLSKGVRESRASLEEKHPEQDQNSTYDYKHLFTIEEGLPEPRAAAAFTSSSPDDVEALKDIVRSQLTGKHTSVLVMSSFVICLTEKIPDSLLADCRNIIDTFHEQTGGAAAGVVYTPESPRSAKIVYGQIKDMLHMPFYEGYHQLFSYTEPPEWKKTDPFLTPSEQREWIDMLIHGFTDQIKDWLYEHFLHMKKPYPEPKLVRTRLTSVLAQVRRYMRTYHLDTVENESAYQELYEDILSGPNVYKIVQNLHLFIQATIERVRRHQVALDPVERGILYMESRYWDPELTLEKVSTEAGRNPFYFSDQLSKVTGSGFRALLTSIRIREAKRLLTDHSLTIKEVAAGCGFHSPNYFSRKFKEKEGMSPKEYRKSAGISKEKELSYADKTSR